MVGVSVVSGLVVLWLWERKLRGRVTVHRINTVKDRTIDGLIDLYIELFKDPTTNYSSGHLLEMIHQHEGKNLGSHVKVEDFILVAQCRGDVVGVLFAHYYCDRRKAMISYYGIDKRVREARQSAGDVLLKRVVRALNSGGRSCDYPFFDVERPDVVRRTGENAKRRARITLFKRDAEAFGLHAYSDLLTYGYGVVSGSWDRMANLRRRHVPGNVVPKAFSSVHKDATALVRWGDHCGANST